MLNRLFALDERQTTVGTEFRGAVATFLTMAYILIVNANILADAGVPQASAVACTALAAGVCCILMGLVANFPLALASGMGLNAIVAYNIAGIAGSWQIAMGLVFLNGVIILFLVLIGLREAVLTAIPRDLRTAIGVGLGLFIALIGAVNAKLVVIPGGTIAVLAQTPDAIMPPVTYGSLRTPEAAVAMLTLLITAFLVARRVKGALIIGIAVGTLEGFIFGIAQLPREFFWPSFEAAFQADIRGALALDTLHIMLPLLFAFIMVDFFDTLGTVTAISDQARLTDSQGRIPSLRRVLIVDSLSASIGGMLGASSVTAYVESAAGVSEGARTGLHTVFVGLFFLLCVFVAPLAIMVPSAATAPALIMVGFLMANHITRINFRDMETAIPAFIIIIMLPFTYSISHGIGYGFITYTAIKLLSGKMREVHPLMGVVTAAFLVYFIWSKV